MDYQLSEQNRFSVVILVFGIISMASLFTGIFPLIFGGLGLTFAIIGHRKNMIRRTPEKLGMTFSIIGLSLGILMTVLAICTILIPYYTDPQVFDQINELYKSYGVDLQGLLNGNMSAYY